MGQSKSKTFVKIIDGKEQARIAHTPADAVRYKFNGWVEKGTQKPVKDTSASGGSTIGRETKN
jgi:hypothetical protein